MQENEKINRAIDHRILLIKQIAASVRLRRDVSLMTTELQRFVQFLTLEKNSMEKTGVLRMSLIYL